MLLEAPFDPIRRQMNSVLLTVDLTKAVADEAIERKDCVVVSYRTHSTSVSATAASERSHAYRSHHIQRLKMSDSGRYTATVAVTPCTGGYKRTKEALVEIQRTHCSSRVSRSTAPTQRLTQHQEVLATGWQTSSPAPCQSPNQPPRRRSRRNPRPTLSTPRRIPFTPRPTLSTPT